MKHTKQISIILLVALLLIFFTTCKKYRQTDKPLYDVLTDHVWKMENDAPYCYHFLPDSICYYNSSVNNDTASEFYEMKMRWWVNEGKKSFNIKWYNMDAEDQIYTYRVVGYNDRKILTFWKLVIVDTTKYDFDPDTTDRKVYFRSIN